MRHARALGGLPLAMLLACRLSTSFSGPALAVQLVANSDRVCAGASGTIAFTLQPPDLSGDGKTIVAPSVALIGAGGQTFPASATFDSKQKQVLVAVPPIGTVGSYGLRVTRHFDGKAATLNDAVIVAAAPVITAVSGQATCVSAQSHAFTLTGSGLGGASVMLRGQEGLGALPTSQLAPSPTAEDRLAVTVPAGLAIGGPYDIVVQTAPGCSTSFAPGVSVVAAPTAVSFEAGPRMSLTSAVEQQAVVTVRIHGTHLLAGANVNVGAAVATSVALAPAVTDGTAVDARFAAGAFGATGTQAAVHLDVGGCGVDVPGALTVEHGAVGISRTNPTALLATDAASYLDVLLAQGETNAVTFAIDVDDDPITQTWVNLPEQTTLDEVGLWHRLQLPATALPLTRPGVGYDVRVLANGGEGLGQAIVEAATAAVPRLVSKDKDSVAEGAGDTVGITGCDFGLAGVSLQLLAADGSVAADGLPLVLPTPAPFYANDFVCHPGRAVDSEARVTIPTDVPAGVYRLAVSRPGGADEQAAATTHQDLYPLVVYAAAPTMAPMQLLTDGAGAVTLAQGRKNAAVVTTLAPSGRKFVYIVGGGTDPNPSPSPLTVGTEETSYEVAAVDPDHHLFGLGSKHGLTIASGSGGGTLPAYGGGLAAAGPRLYWLGGGTDDLGTALSSAIYTTTLDEAGALADWTDTGKVLCGQASGSDCAAGQDLPTFGMAVGVLRSGNKRVLSAWGGAMVQGGFYVSVPNNLAADLNAQGQVSAQLLASGTVDPSVAGQSFATTLAQEGSLGVFFGGIDAVNGTLGAAFDRRQQVVLTGGVANMPASSALTDGHGPGDGLFNFGFAKSDQSGRRVQLPEVGLETSRTGPRHWFFGGLTVAFDDVGSTNNFNYSSVVWSASTPRNRVMTFDEANGLAFSAASVTQLERRAYAALVHLPPYVYLVSGVVCGIDEGSTGTQACDQITDRQLSANIETSSFR